MDRHDVHIRTVCVFPDGDDLAQHARISPVHLADRNIIHTRRDSEFFQELSRAFMNAQVELNSHIEVRQFTAACELVCHRVGVAVVSALDAEQYRDRGLDFRPFTPNLPHALSLVRPVLKRPSLLTLEFMEQFRESLTPYEVRP